jgi:acetyltransferase-like isoleucine patch superfamily enzyme
MKVQDSGKNNKISSDVSNEKLSGLTINFKGNNNKIHIGKNARVDSGQIFINGDSNELLFGKSTRCGNIRIIMQDGSLIDVGEKTTIEQAYILSRDGCQVVFGKDCMISFQVDFRTSDAHGIYDLETGDLVNSPGNIILEDHVWITQGVIVSKNVRIGENSIVGSRSFVQNSVIPPHCIYAGTPARLIREKVRWTRAMFEKPGQSL